MIRSLIGLAFGCIVLTNLGLAEESRKDAPASTIVLSCADDGDASVRFFALYAEDDVNKLTWDVAVDETTKSVLVAGMLKAQVQWDLNEANQKELDDLLKQVQANRYRPVLLLAVGVWGDFDNEAHWPRHQRKLVVRSVTQTALGLTPAILQYQNIDPDQLRECSDRMLVMEYQRIGAKLFGTPYEPGAWPAPASPIYDTYVKAKMDDFYSIRCEIVRREDTIVPFLVKLLRKEINKAPERTRTKREAEFLGPPPSFRSPLLSDADRPSFAVDLMHLLATIGDRRPAKFFLQIAEGLDGKSTPSQQRAAMRGLERLTYVSLRTLGPYEGIAGLLIEHPVVSQLDQNDKDVFDWQVEFFREWLAGEGKNAAEWLPLARRRARLLLDSDEPAHVYRGAQFLRPVDHDPLRGGLYETGHDDDPDRTLDRIAEKMATFQTHGVNFYWKNNYLVPGDRGAWVQLLTNHGTRARKHASLVIGSRLHDHQLSPVGGDEILQYVFERLDAVPDSKVSLRQIIDRWAGRHFDSDDDRKAWWRDNREVSDEDRLRASLPLLVAQTDERNPAANSIVMVILPDAPPYHQPGKTGNYVAGPSRVEWFKEHSAQLNYDSERGLFRLAGTSDGN